MKSDLAKLLDEISNTSPIENIEEIYPYGFGALINDIRKEARRVDAELDLVHKCLKELYEVDSAVPIIKKYLNKIEKIEQ